MKRMTLWITLALPSVVWAQAPNPAAEIRREMINEELNAPDLHGVQRSLARNFQTDYAQGGQFGVSGKGYGKGGFHFGPVICVWSDFYRWGYIGAGFKMNYREAYFKAIYKYTLPFQEVILPKMGNSTVVTFGLNFMGWEIYNELEGGKVPTTMNALNTITEYRYTAELGFTNHIGIKALLHDDLRNRLELELKGGIRVYTEVGEQFYDARVTLKYRNKHPWGEFLFAGFSWHASAWDLSKPADDYRLESGINLWEDVLMAPYVLGQNDATSSYFNTLTAVNLEYRLYFLTPLYGGWRNFYMAAQAGLGFGFRHGNYAWTGDLSKDFKEHGLYWYGGSLGYLFHDALAAQFGVLFSNKGELLVQIGVDMLSFSF